MNRRLSSRQWFVIITGLLVCAGSAIAAFAVSGMAQPAAPQEERTFWGLLASGCLLPAAAAIVYMVFSLAQKAPKK